jgi:hypothetical protein
LLDPEDTVGFSIQRCVTYTGNRASSKIYSTLTAKAIRSFETSVAIHESRRRNIPEEQDPHKSCLVLKTYCVHRIS